MSDEIALRKDMERAAQAIALLENPIFAEAFASLEKAYFDTWKQTGIRDDAGREKLWLAVKVMGDVKAHLEAVVSNGTVAKKELERLASRPKRFGVV